jgi:hypothetical protein
MNPLEGMAYVQQQGELGRQRGQQNRLAALASQAYAAPVDQQRGLVQQAIATNPDAGFGLGKSLQDDKQQRLAGMSQKARMLVAYAKSGNRAGVDGLYPQIAQEAQALGLGQNIPPTWDDSYLAGMEQLANIGGGTSGTGVQSTYVDAQGNRVAILRDGSTQVLGLNAPQNQIIDTGNGFYGVNKGNLQAAPVMVGAPQQQAAPQPWAQAGAKYQTPQGIVQIGADLTPEQLEAVQADMASGGQSDAYALPDRAVSPQQFGGQLRSAPKTPSVPSGYRANPDGSLSMIPGGPAEVAAQAREDARMARQAAEAAKAEQKAQGDRARQQASAEASQQLVSAIDSLTRHPGFAELGTVTGDLKLKAPLIRNDVKDASAQLKNIAGQVALSTMATLKALSSQGATGFGALSAPELRLLENSIATLQQDEISNAQIQQSLRTIREKVEKVANWRPEPTMHAPAPADAPRSNAIPAQGGGVDDLLSKYGVR